MSDADNNAFAGFAKLVPGFDFLQNLTKQAAGAGKGVPGMPDLGSWVAPTISVEEIDKRIAELKTVQFWLDQNATALKATIQALEVQKMTLSTLQGMNVNMAEMAKAFQVKLPDSFAQAMNPAAAPAPEAEEGAEPSDAKPHQFAGLEVPESPFLKRLADAEKPKEVKEAKEDKTSKRAEPEAAPAAAPSVVDPMQWWNALTQQFQGIAAHAMKEVAEKTSGDLAKLPAAGLAKDAVNTATGLARDITETATKAMNTQASGARDLMSTALRAQPWPVPGAKVAKPSKAPAKKAARAPAKTARKAAPAAAKAPSRAAAGAVAKKTAKPARKGAASRSR
jgi:hypothetical protein